MGATNAETDGVVKDYPQTRVWDVKMYVIHSRDTDTIFPFTNADTANGAIQYFLHRVRPTHFPPFPVGGQLVGNNPETFWEELKAVKGVDVRRCFVTDPLVEDLESNDTI